MCPRTERHRTANLRPLDQQDDSAWLCGNCGYNLPNKPEYPLRNSQFKHTRARAKTA
jgi:hypothetical protein